MILQAGRRYFASPVYRTLPAYVCRLSDRLEQLAGMAGYAGLRRLRFSFFLDEPRAVLPAFGRMSLVARAPSAAEWFRRRAEVWRKGLLELGACSSVG
jgi:hypothetical protein